MSSHSVHGFVLQSPGTFNSQVNPMHRTAASSVSIGSVHGTPVFISSRHTSTVVSAPTEPGGGWQGPHGGTAGRRPGASASRQHERCSSSALLQHRHQPHGISSCARISLPADFHLPRNFFLHHAASSLFSRTDHIFQLFHGSFLILSSSRIVFQRGSISIFVLTRHMFTGNGAGQQRKACGRRTQPLADIYLFLMHFSITSTHPSHLHCPPRPSAHPAAASTEQGQAAGSRPAISNARRPVSMARLSSPAFHAVSNGIINIINTFTPHRFHRFTHRVHPAHTPNGQCNHFAARRDRSQIQFTAFLFISSPITRIHAPSSVVLISPAGHRWAGAVSGILKFTMVTWVSLNGARISSRFQSSSLHSISLQSVTQFHSSQIIIHPIFFILTDLSFITVSSPHGEVTHFTDLHHQSLHSAASHHIIASSISSLLITTPRSRPGRSFHTAFHLNATSSGSGRQQALSVTALTFYCHRGRIFHLHKIHAEHISICISASFQLKFTARHGISSFHKTASSFNFIIHVHHHGVSLI